MAYTGRNRHTDFLSRNVVCFESTEKVFFVLFLAQRLLE